MLICGLINANVPLELFDAGDRALDGVFETAAFKLEIQCNMFGWSGC